MNQIKLLTLLILVSLLSTSCKVEDDETIIPKQPELEIPKESTGESLVYNSSLVYDGYVLVPEITNNRVYLITKERGEIIYEWNLAAKLGVDAELMDDGRLLVALKSENPSFDNIGGNGGRRQ